MSTYDLGDVVTLSAVVRDATGALVDAGSIVCTITLPDDTTATPTVTRVSLGTYTATYTPTVAGRHMVRWVTTGAGAAADVDDFVILTAPVAAGLASMATPDRVGRMLAQTIDDLQDVDAESLQQACDDANAIVLEHLMRADLGTLAPHVAAAVTFVATKIAARIYRNPRELSNYSFNDVGQTFVDPRILTGDEKAQLKQARSARVVRGPIITSGTASVI